MSSHLLLYIAHDAVFLPKHPMRGPHPRHKARLTNVFATQDIKRVFKTTAMVAAANGSQPPPSYSAKWFFRLKTHQLCDG
jgi:hypothetical protein